MVVGNLILPGFEELGSRLETIRMNVELKRTWQCPHPYCTHQPETLTNTEIRQHITKFHKCGRCNHGKHHKCKGLDSISFCGCRDCHKGPEIDKVYSSLEYNRNEERRKAARDSLLGIVKRAT